MKRIILMFLLGLTLITRAFDELCCVTFSIRRSCDNFRVAAASNIDVRRRNSLKRCSHCNKWLQSKCVIFSNRSESKSRFADVTGQTNHTWICMRARHQKKKKKKKPNIWASVQTYLFRRRYAVPPVDPLTASPITHRPKRDGGPINLRLCTMTLSAWSYHNTYA